MKNFYFCLISLLLASCSPVYKKDFDYVPPIKVHELDCIEDCNNKWDYCNKSEYGQHYDCDLERGISLKKCQDTNDDSDYDIVCSTLYPSCKSPDYDNCQKVYNYCYTTCGGTVIDKTICVMFCDKK